MRIVLAWGPREKPGKSVKASRQTVAVREARVLHVSACSLQRPQRVKQELLLLKRLFKEKTNPQ